MIEPNKYMNIDLSIVNISASIIEILLNRGATKYTNVQKNVEQKLGESCKYEFQNALSFLFLLNKLRYDNENDILELIL